MGGVLTFINRKEMNCENWERVMLILFGASSYVVHASLGQA